MKTEICAVDAKARLPELLRQVKAAKQFTSTNRGKAIADLIASEASHPAVALIESRGVEGIRPELHESRGELARVLGDEAGALQELREAHRLYVAINATGHAARLGQIIRTESRGAG